MTTDPTDSHYRALHRLVFGQEPSSAAPADFAPGRLLGTLAALLGSERFQTEVAEPALEGTLDRVDDLADAGLQNWAELTFSLPHVVEEPRLNLLARVLESAALNAMLSSLPVMWSPGALADALRAALRHPAAFWTPPANAALAVARVARGLLVQHVSGLLIGARPQGLRFDPGERWIMMRPFFEGIDSAEFCRIDFGLIGEAERPDTRLYIDYGDGFCATQLLPLEARGRSRYSAFLAAPGSIKALRWDLGEVGASCRLTLLSAREISRVEVAQRTMAVAGEPGLDWLAGRRLPDLRPNRPEPMAFRLSRALTRALGGHESERSYTYADWLADNEPSGTLSEAQDRRDLALLPARPTIDLILPIGEPDPIAVCQTIKSVRQQVYPAWRLHLLYLDEGARELRHLWAANFAENRVLEDPTCSGLSMSAALNAASQRTEGDWIGLLHPGELLRPNALLRLAQSVAATPDAEVVYADHDQLDSAGIRSAPVFKPDYAPETLLGSNYIAGPALLRAEAVRAVGGWDDAATGAESYDLLLRLTGGADVSKVAHVAEVLAHRTEPVATGKSAGPELDAVQRQLARLGRDLVAESLTCHSGRRIRAGLPNPAPLVSLVIPTRDKADLLATCIRSILEHTDYEPYEIIVVDNGSIEPATRDLFASWEGESRIRVLSQPGPFNYARINNAAVSEARGEVIGLVNNDIEAISPGWLEELVSWAVQPEIGCVGAKLLFPNETVQHGGIVLGIGGVAAHAHKYAPRDAEGYNGRLAHVHNVSAVTGACLVVRRAIYQQLGGLDEAFAVAYNDVDFCLRVQDAGYRNLFTPFAELYHHESVTRGSDDAPEKAARLAEEVTLMRARWGDRLRVDPYYSPNLTQVYENFSFNNPAPAWSWSRPLQATVA